MRIAVTGGAGAVGSLVVAALAERGADVVALVRDAGRVRTPGATAAVVAYDDPASLATALTGVERLVFIGSDGEADRMLVHHRNVLDCAHRAGVERIVLLGSQGTDTESPFCYAHAYDATERWLADACPEPVVVRAGLYAEFFGRWVLEAADTGRLSLPMPTGAVAPVARADVAEALVQVVLSPHPAALTVVTGAESFNHAGLAGMASRLAGTAVRSSPCSAAEFDRRLLEAEPSLWWRYAFSTLFAAIEEGRFAATTDAIHRLTGRPPVAFHDALRAARAGVSGARVP